MATQKQLQANRENAKRSTGPRTAAGRLKASRNARRHGLSLPVTLDAKELAKAELMVRMLVPDQADETQVVATELAQAHLVVMRVGAIRNKMMAEVDPATADLVQLWRLAALDRYEARALTRRRRASQALNRKNSQNEPNFLNFSQ
jgi:hypothetical protein